MTMYQPCRQCIRQAHLRRGEGADILAATHVLEKTAQRNLYVFDLIDWHIQLVEQKPQRIDGRMRAATRGVGLDRAAGEFPYGAEIGIQCFGG
ncbi:hypothetical protein D3C80_2039410 [compost metagenome]